MQVRSSGNKLALEEAYIGGRWLIAIAVMFALIALGPGVVAVVEKGSVELLAMGGLFVFVFYLSFFAVFALSRYRRVEIDTGDGSIDSWVVYRLWQPKVRHFAADEVREVVCERVSSDEGEVPDGLRVVLLGCDGTRTPLIKRAAWSDEVVQQLRSALAGKLVTQ